MPIATFDVLSRAWRSSLYGFAATCPSGTFAVDSGSSRSSASEIATTWSLAYSFSAPTTWIGS
ncbi:hypothetical protein OHV08_01025 [Streptomyces canus]